MNCKIFGLRRNRRQQALGTPHLLHRDCNSIARSCKAFPIAAVCGLSRLHHSKRDREREKRSEDNALSTYCDDLVIKQKSEDVLLTATKAMTVVSRGSSVLSCPRTLPEVSNGSEKRQLHPEDSPEVDLVKKSHSPSATSRQTNQQSSTAAELGMVDNNPRDFPFEQSFLSCIPESSPPLENDEDILRGDEGRCMKKRIFELLETEYFENKAALVFRHCIEKERSWDGGREDGGERTLGCTKDERLQHKAQTQKISYTSAFMSILNLPMRVCEHELPELEITENDPLVMAGVDRFHDLPEQSSSLRFTEPFPESDVRVHFVKTSYQNNGIKCASLKEDGVGEVSTQLGVYRQCSESGMLSVDRRAGWLKVRAAESVSSVPAPNQTHRVPEWISFQNLTVSTNEGCSSGPGDNVSVFRTGQLLGRSRSETAFTANCITKARHCATEQRLLDPPHQSKTLKENLLDPTYFF
ncbi:hypothetical protein C0J52_26528 [Blattella germanica]|nr:hypothetical protein C0J52_26528 [Blattella germanica]